MIEAKIEPRDLMSLNLAMTKLDAEVLLQGEWDPFLVRVVDVVGKYPPDFPGNTYKRTGHLGDSWHKEVINPLSAQVQNVAIYAGWVHGHEQQAGHAGHGWVHLYEKAKWLLGFLIEKIGDKAERIWSQS